MKKLIKNMGIALVLIFIIIGKPVLSQTYLAPINTSLSNDGYTYVNISDIGLNKALDVNVVQSAVSSTAIPVITTTSSTFIGNQITISNIATLITPTNTNRKSLLIRNQGATDMYVLGSGVTTTNGLLIKTSEVLILDRTTAALYGIVSAGSTTVSYLEE
jgi:hypothetical protein